MALTIKNRAAMTANPESSAALKVLLMSENDADLASCRELLRSPGCTVQMCSNYVELLLHLEHEAFQLVIMFEEEESPSAWQGVIKQAAEAGNGTPVLIFKRSEEFSLLNETLAS